MISIKKNLSKDLFEIFFEQTTSKEEFYEFCNFIKTNKSISRILNLVFIAPNGIKNVDYSNITRVLHGIKNATDHYDKVNLAVTVCKHRESLLCSVFKKLISDSKIQCEHFACLKDAIRWVRRQNTSSYSTHKNAG